MAASPEYPVSALPAALGYRKQASVQLLCGCWECEFRSSCLQGKHFTNQAISLGPSSENLLGKDSHLALMHKS